jgi:hypothetical protein
MPLNLTSPGTMEEVDEDAGSAVGAWAHAAG